MQRLEVGGAVQHTYIYIYTHMLLGGKGLNQFLLTMVLSIEELVFLDEHVFREG
jgi:hypothetical protein